MKKTLIFSILALVLTLLVTGCSYWSEHNTDGEQNTDGEHNTDGEQNTDGEEKNDDEESSDDEQISDGIRHTVTAEEWADLKNELNFTVEVVSGEASAFQRSTEDALEVEGTIILFIDALQYCLSETENGLVAYDCTFVNYGHSGPLADVEFDDYFYDESILAYVNKNYEEIGSRLELRFENGVIISATSWVLGDEDFIASELLFTNVGTTVIDIPEFTFYYDLEIDPKYLVTEEIWSLYVNEKNYVAEYSAFVGFDYYECILKSTEDAVELDGEIIVSDSDKKYVLKEVDGVWYAEEYNGIGIPESLLPEGLDFDDFEFDMQYKMYVQKNTEGADEVYSLAFEDGVLLYVQIEKSPDPTGS